MTIRELFEKNVERNPDRNFLVFRDGGVRGVLKRTISRTYIETRAAARTLSEVAIAALALRPREDVAAIMLDNSATWIELYLGLCSIAITVVPIDPKLRPGELAYILADAKVKAIFTDKRHCDVLEQALPAGAGALESVILADMEADAQPPSVAGRQVYSLEALKSGAKAAAASPGAAYDRFSPVDDDIASVIYTSGTTGRPKGAMLSHSNFCTDAQAGVDMFPDFSWRREEEFFVVLPLFHALSFTTNFLMLMCVGATMQFATSLRTIGDDMRTFRPTILFAVPLLVEKMYEKVEDGIKNNALAKAMSRLGLREMLTAAIRAKFGGRIRLIVVGGAPCSAQLLKAMGDLKMPIVEGYGLTEASPVVSIRPYNDTHIGTIGLPLKGAVEVSLAEQDENGVGELLVRGPVVMKGYLGNPEATAEAIDADGWLHTGDLASRDADGFLTIRGRKKALIVNREGKNIYPEEVEICIGHDRRVQDVIVVGYSEGGETGEKVGAIVVPSLDIFREENRGREPEWPEIEHTMKAIVAERCRELAEYKTPRKVAVFRDPLERTSVGKIRRVKYQHALDA